MYKILSMSRLAANVFRVEVEAGGAARNARPGQFVIVRLEEGGERVPFTIFAADKERDSITMLIQEAGYTTTLLGRKGAGDYIADLTGPLGHPTNVEQFDRVILVGGGIGAAVIFPQACHLHSLGKPADVILGARNQSLLICRDELENISASLTIMTDDGSCGQKGFVTDALKDALNDAANINGKERMCVFAVGPLPMMRAVCAITREYGVHTIVSMNSIMLDGTGMCGCCRLTVGGKLKYTCVHGPEFDGHLIDWAEAANRLTMFKEQEAEHRCRLNESKTSTTRN